MRAAVTLALFAAILTGACAESPVGNNDPICPHVTYASIKVTPRDSVTGDYIGDSTTMIQTATGYADSLTLILPPLYPWEQALWLETSNDRAGIYEVTIRRAGYATWQRTNVEVTMATACFVETVELQALLQPLP